MVKYISIGQYKQENTFTNFILYVNVLPLYSETNLLNSDGQYLVKHKNKQTTPLANTKLQNRQNKDNDKCW